MEQSVPEMHTGSHLLRAALYEFLGTAMIIAAYNFTYTEYLGRAFSYFVLWMIAVAVSGAHFNPATSLAVYIAEGKYGRQLGRLLVYWIAQICGAFFGIFFVYFIFNQPVNGFLLWPQIQLPFVRIWFFSQLGNIYYAKIAVIEATQTMVFSLCYLTIMYRPVYRTTDEIIKGIGISTCLWANYALSAGSGACYNPALGIAQSAYQVGFLNAMDNNGNGFASLIWVYGAIPLAGALLAGIWFKIRVSNDNKALQQQLPAGASIQQNVQQLPA